VPGRADPPGRDSDGAYRRLPLASVVAGAALTRPSAVPIGEKYRSVRLFLRPSSSLRCAYGGGSACQGNRSRRISPRFS